VTSVPSDWGKTSWEAEQSVPSPLTANTSSPRRRKAASSKLSKHETEAGVNGALSNFCLVEIELMAESFPSSEVLSWDRFWDMKVEALVA
jgi:hypothetical protein